MNLLALEFSTPHLSVALFQQSRLVGEILRQPDGHGHAEVLLPLIDQFFSQYKTSLDQIEALAVSIGPGSFTSLRVGLATILGLSAKPTRPIYPVSTLKALCLGLKETDLTCVPVMRAGRGRVYAAAYHLSSTTGPHVVLPEGIFEPKELMSQVQKLGEPLGFLGPGLEMIPQISEARYFDSITPRASWIGQLAFQASTQPVTPNELQIRYLQPPDLGKN